MLTLIENILFNIVNRSITLSKETDFVFDFLSENIKTTRCADRSAGADRISQSDFGTSCPRFQFETQTTGYKNDNTGAALGLV